MTLLAKVGAALLILSCSAWAEQGVLTVHVKDTLGHPISEIRLSTEGDGSLSPPTDVSGKTRIKLSPQTQPSSRITLQIVSSPTHHDYVFIDPWDSRVQVPLFDNQSENYVSVVVVERGNRLILEDPKALRAIVSRLNKENVGTASNDGSTRQNALRTVADSFGLSPVDIDKALKAWKVSDDSFEKGLKNYYLGRYPEAIGDLTDAYSKRRADLRGVLLPLADSLYRASRYPEAVVKYKEAISLSGDDPALLVKLASALEQNGDFEGSKDTATQAVEAAKAEHGKLSPEAADALFTLGSIYINHGDTTRGMALFDEAIKLHDFDLNRHDLRPMSYLTSLSAIQIGEGKLTLARESLERAIAFGDKHQAPPELQGFTQATLTALLIKEGHVRQADAIVKKWIDILNSIRPIMDSQRTVRNTTFQFLCGYLIDVYLAEGRFNKHTGDVIDQCLNNSRALNGPSSSATVLILQQKAIWEINRAAFADAEKTYGLLLEIDERVQGQYHPQVLGVRSQLINLYVTQKRIKEAESAALEIDTRAKNPKHVLDSPDMSHFAQLIQIYRTEGKPEAELKELIGEMKERVRNDYTLESALLLFLGLEAQSRNDLPEAERLLNEVLQAAPEGSFPYYDAMRFKGILAAKQGHMDAASSYFDKALKFVEHDPDLTIRFESQVIADWALALSQAPNIQEQQIMGLLERLKRHKHADRSIGLLWMLISDQRSRQKDLPGAEAALKTGCNAFDDSENATLTDVANCLLNLGKLQHTMHLYSESERNLLKALSVAEEGYDADSPFLRPYLNSLIDLYKKLRQKGKVKDLQKRLEAVGTCPTCDSQIVVF